MITVNGRTFERKRDWAARVVEFNWRVRQRLPRVTAYAEKCGLDVVAKGDCLNW